MESSPDFEKGGSIPWPITTNAAYGIMKLGRQDEPVYEVVNVPPESRSYRQPFPDIPLPVAPHTESGCDLGRGGTGSVL